MKKILLLNGGKQFAHSNGQYNATLHEAAAAGRVRQLTMIWANAVLSACSINKAAITSSTACCWAMARLNFI